ncbi:MAG: sulfite exporter TauE/SafE family protein [Chitinophagaceae bacterium]
MDNPIILIAIGFLIGALGTMIGAGGGFLLVPLLIFTHPAMPAGVTTAISIAVVALNAISGSIAYSRAGRIDYKAGLLFGLFTIPGSVLGVFLVKYIPKHAFNIVFGIILIAVAVYLFIKNKKSDEENPARITENGKGTTHRLTDRNGEQFIYSFNKAYGIIISVIVGFLSPLLGIGGGIIHVPAMVQWLRFPVYIATATSHFILAIMSTVSVIVHIVQGSYQDSAVQQLLLYLCIGVIPGAQVGAYISHKIDATLIIKLLAICLGLVGLRILL